MQSIHVALGHRQRGDARVAEWSSSLVRIAGGKGGVAVVDVALTCMWREFHTLPLIATATPSITVVLRRERHSTQLQGKSDR